MDVDARDSIGTGRGLAGMAWLARNLLLMVARWSATVTHVQMVEAGQRGPADVAFRQCLLTQLPLEKGPARLLTLDCDALPAVDDLRLQIVTDAGARESPNILVAVQPLQTLLRELLAPLSPENRSTALDFIVRAGTEHGRPPSMAMSNRLHLVRQALRERLPEAGEGPLAPQLSAAQILAADEHHLLLRGTCSLGPEDIRDLAAISPEGERVDLLHSKNSGGAGPRATPFCARVDVDVPSLVDTGWLIEIETSWGERYESTVPAVLRDPARIGELLLDGPASVRGTEADVGSFVEATMLRHLREVRVVEVLQFGVPAAQPDVSLVIALTGKGDLLGHQLAEFSRDRDFASVDLILVADTNDPGPVATTARQLADLYRMSFRILVLDREAGLAISLHLGACHAAGDLVVFLEPRALPEAPGWVQKLADIYRTSPGIGALGALSVYEDDAIYQAGVSFRREDGILWPHSPLQGIHRSYLDAHTPWQVRAVSGTCTMVAASLLQEVGGLCGLPRTPDAGVEDLCLRLLTAGYTNWQVTTPVVYHLASEGSDPNRPPAQAVARYGSWREALQRDTFLQQPDVVMEPAGAAAEGESQWH